MNALSDIAMIAFACTMSIHMGLVDAVMSVLRIKHLPIVTCPRCFSWWACMAYCVFVGHNLVQSFAMSFLFSYLSVWFDLFLGYLDTWYEAFYEKINDTDVCDKGDRDNKGKNTALPQV